MYAARKLIVVALAAALGLSLAHAQDVYPGRPVRLVVGYSVGGGNDIIARLIAGKMSDGLGQPVIVENRPGAESTIAAEMVARAAPDGYTILMGASGPMTVSPATRSKLKYSPLRDFAPIAIIGHFPLMLAVNSQIPAKSVQELIEYARANPTRINYGSSAAPFQLAAELFNQKAGTGFVHIPYKGGGDSVNAVASGEVTIAISTPPSFTGALKAGKVRALAVTGAVRLSTLPEIPTMSEAGMPDLEFSIWTGLVAPAGTAPAFVRRLQQELVRVLQIPEIRQRLLALGVEPTGSTSEEFGRIIAADLARWTAVARSANIRFD